MAVRIVEKPFTRGRVAGLVWGSFATALGGGLFLGAAIGGLLADDLLEGASGAITLTVGSVALLIQLGRRTSVGMVPRAGLFLTTWVGAIGIFYGAREAQDLRYMAQLRAWFGTLEAKVGVGLVVVGLALAIALMFRSPMRTAGEGG